MSKWIHAPNQEEHSIAFPAIFEFGSTSLLFVTLCVDFAYPTARCPVDGCNIQFTEKTAKIESLMDQLLGYQGTDQTPNGLI
jgi:hypothetical protein